MKIIKKINNIFYFTLFLTAFLIPLTTAQTDSQDPLNRGAEIVFLSVTSLFEKIYNVSLPALTITLETAFILILFLILSTIIYWTIEQIEIFPQNTILKVIVSIAISGLAYIAIPKQFFQLILPSYTAAFSTIPTAIIFGFIFFICMRIRSQFIARIIWLSMVLFSGVVMITQGYPAIQENKNALLILYFILLGVNLIILYFFEEIRKYFYNEEAKETTRKMEFNADKSDAVQKSDIKRGETLGNIAKKK
ncbi:MAG: hypothetical protein ACI83O_000661 [Patescibacteria group bacterium]|jgi:hypothetical protein